MTNYTEDDVQLVATTLHADLCGCGDWDAADLSASLESRGFAERVLEALATAGRLLPAIPAARDPDGQPWTGQRWWT